jgi:uroporphyrin-III C-methyltransferase/precorrin-2 dehydrogenase/sirohydrochlorin ferrochelatase
MLCAPGHTAVFYMGLSRIEYITGKLLEHGAAAQLPAAIIVQGTLPQQRVIVATLATLADAAARAALESPALLVVGEVAALHESLAWFGDPTTDHASQSAG